MALDYRLRPASSRLQDGNNFLKILDTQLPYLAQIGSAGQWGTDSLAASEKAQEKYKRIVEQSEKELPWGIDWAGFYFLELEGDARFFPQNISPSMILYDPQTARPGVPIATMILEGRSPDYVREVLPEQDQDDPFLYLKFLSSNRDVGRLSKGAGRMLLDHAETIAKTFPVRRICLDGWNANGRMLVK